MSWNKQAAYSVQEWKGSKISYYCCGTKMGLSQGCFFGRNRGEKKAVVVVIYSRDFGATRLVLWQDLASWLVEPVSMISVVA